MTDDTPYIIVDNRKISPIERSVRPNSATAERKGRKEHTFGVVDRVTISREARERSMQPPALDDLSREPSTSNNPQLTYSRGKRP